MKWKEGLGKDKKAPRSNWLAEITDFFPYSSESWKSKIRVPAWDLVNCLFWGKGVQIVIFSLYHPMIERQWDSCLGAHVKGTSPVHKGFPTPFLTFNLKGHTSQQYCLRHWAFLIWILGEHKCSVLLRYKGAPQSRWKKWKYKISSFW